MRDAGIDRFRKIFEHTNDAIFLVDPELDEILDANPRACAMVGYSRRELLELGMSAIHPDEMTQLRDFAHHVFAEGKGWTDELSCLTKSGLSVPAEISASIFEVDGRQVMIAMVRDISERKELERALERQSRTLEEKVRVSHTRLRRSEQQLRALLEIARAVSAHLERPDLFQAVGRAIAQLVPYDRMGVLLPADDEGAMSLYAWESKSEASGLAPGMRFPRTGTAPAWVLENRRVYMSSRLEDLRRFPASYRAVAEEGTESSCVAPLVVEGRPVGVLVLHAEQPGSYDDLDLALLEEVASLIAVALDNSLAYEEIKRLKKELEQENVYLHEEIETEHKFDEIVGQSGSIREVLRSVETVAPTGATVLITGETGTGKGLIARAIHGLSPRSAKPLVKVNCAALPAELIESELFGYERGAFTGATARRTGRFELAHCGAIFLDEIGELPLPLQAKLLNVLQDGELQRVGGAETIEVDVQVIAATNRDLESSVAEGRFRSDLYYRLNVFPITVPSLRERREDVPLLVRHFVMKYAAKLGKKIETIPRDAVVSLRSYAWPGNVRELENLVERAVILSTGARLDTSSWKLKSPAGNISSGVPTLDDVQRHHILDVLEQTHWRVSGRGGAAELLGLKPTTLESRMKKLGLARKKRA